MGPVLHGEQYISNGILMAKTALIFPGQGSQYSGLGKEAYRLSTFSDEIYHTASSILGYNIKDISFNATIEEISNTKYAQPAIFIHSILASYNLRDRNISFNMVAGHSLGEISALTVANAITIEDALKIIKIRASRMETCGYERPGSMLALINPTEKQIDKICNIESIVIANINSPQQIVVSGEENKINEALELSKKINIRKAIKLNVSGALHSPLMKGVTEDLKKVLDDVNFNDAIVPVYQNMTCKPTTKAADLKINLLNQIENPVNWVKIINNMDNNETGLYIETGPGDVLQGLNRRITKNKTMNFNEM